MTDISHIQHLLKDVSLIVKKHKDEITKLDAEGKRFNVFELCGVAHYETTHSKIISEFLNPQGSHGLGHELLDAFLSELPQGAKPHDFDSTTARTDRERGAKQFGRIDIIIEDGKGKVLLIENKVYACDGNEQLRRYNDFLTTIKELDKGEFTILYLTLRGHDASAQSAQDVNYTSISYDDFIMRWLEKCVKLAGKHPFVRESLKQYINHIKFLTGKNTEQTMDQEIFKLILKDVNMYDAYKALRGIVLDHDAFDKCLYEIYFSEVTQETGTFLRHISIPNETPTGDYYKRYSVQFSNSSLEKNHLGILFFGYDKFQFSYGLDGKRPPKVLENKLKQLFREKYSTGESSEFATIPDFILGRLIDNGHDEGSCGRVGKFSNDAKNIFVKTINEMITMFEEAKKSTPAL